MAEPPSFSGALQETTIFAVPSAIAATPAGGSGAVRCVVSPSLSEASDVPTALIAETR